ncbi:hypothetical protein K450DRAFT_251091 [Umbelopsis ramanniana AG]|uniref:RNA polymerase II elongation factor ELL N-terminal domain-containing protein n=1 Tax=Umbelopsis ramanniana AG TaxID=1314678 RepID=A0AAD5E537_UMBRA|nr:uncharacterized protein K450DRAFT_251091 [Umbelopsis ramanniana AG]KAI8577648.1 hypothetical protein K450DRAFT_251091 [Umbelopsis ramanniana AG]
MSSSVAMSASAGSTLPSPPAKAISMRLNREAFAYLEELTEKSALRGQAQPKLSVCFGDTPAIIIEGRTFPFTMTKDTAYTQIYKRRSADSLTSVSEVSHKANMTPMLSSDYKSRVKARAEEAEREKKSRKIALIDNPLGPSSNMKSSRALNSNSKRPSGSPTTGAMHSPVIVSSPGNDVSRAPSISSSLRERVIQLLALKPFKLSLLANMVKASEKDLMRMIRKVATSTGDTWTLKPDIYKEIKIWDWNRYDTKEKEEVANNARRAFDTLKLPVSAPERLRLEKPAPPIRPPKAKPAASPSMNAMHHGDEQDGDSATHRLNEDGKKTKKKKKASTTSASRKSTKATSKSISVTAKAVTTSSETSPSHLKPSVITPPSNKAPSPLKPTPSSHDRHGGKSPLAGKHTHSSATPSTQDTLPDHAITKRRSDEEISSLRYKIPKRSELSKHSLSRSDSEGKRKLSKNDIVYLITNECGKIIEHMHSFCRINRIIRQRC